jgi:hypothetical protein
MVPVLIFEISLRFSFSREDDLGAHMRKIKISHVDASPAWKNQYFRTPFRADSWSNHTKKNQF